jgi:Kunitz/Bovine pancreatic trypsin inhibitor domain
MSQLAAASRAAILAALVVSFGGACGGQAFSRGDETGGSAPGGGSQGGSSSKAGSTSGGTTGKAGSAQGGTSVGGGAAGTGQGGSLNDACSAPAAPGQCQAYFEAWYHDANTGVCMPFVYGGCGGNANRYDSLEACQQACPGGSPNYDSCKVASDCVVTGPGCCGICDGPGIRAHDLIAYASQYAGLLQCGVALDKAAAPADPVACAPCPAPPPGQGSLHYFIPDCVRGECTVLDLRNSPATACEKDQDCKVRNGTNCCEACSSDQPIAVRNDGSFEELLCAGGPVPCPACIPSTGGLRAECSQGHCAIVDTLK